MISLLLFFCQHFLVKLKALLILLSGLHLIEDVVDAVQETVSDLAFHSSINYYCAIINAFIIKKLFLLFSYASTEVVSRSSCLDILNCYHSSREIHLGVCLGSGPSGLAIIVWELSMLPGFSCCVSVLFWEDLRLVSK